MRDEILINLKKAIWLYFYLLIFEGALRKWVLPEFADVLLIIRDPLAIWILFQAFKNSFWKPNAYVVIMWSITVLSFSLALFAGHGNITVALYGLRITAIHFPLIFVIGNIFNKEDVMSLGKIVLWLNIGMTLLVAVQFYSPQSAWINQGVGGDLNGSGFGGVGEFYRVPGTFSFTNGLAYFYGLAAAFIFYFWIDNYNKKVKGFLLLASTLALLAAIPLSISRAVFFQVIVTLVFMVAISGRNPLILKRIGFVFIAGGLLLGIISYFSFFQTSVDVFTERFTSANTIEGGLVEGVFIDRFLGGMFEAISTEKFPFWGLGLGMGTNVGAKILVGDITDYLVAEEEWGRLIGELGVILGFAIILVRISFVIFLLKEAWEAINKGNVLPWMLLSFGMFVILQGQWAQPTSLGFSTLIAGLIIASLKANES